MFIFGAEADSGYSLTACGEAVNFSEPFLICTPTVVLGSAEDNEIFIDDPRVAEHHCRIELGEMGAYLVDLHSPAGTFLNGKRITRALLREGDSIRLVPPTGASTRVVPAVPATTGPVTTVELVNKSLPLTQVQRPDTVMLDPGRDRDKRRLEALLAVSTTLARPDTIENRLDQIVALMLQMMDFDRAGIWVLERDCPATDPEPRFAYQAQRNSRSAEHRLEVSKTIIRKVLTSEEGLLVKDALFSSEFGEAQSVRAQDIRTCVCFPLKTQSVLGVLYADAQRKTEQVTEEDLSFVAAFAAQAAVAVENTLLSQQIEKEAVVRSRFERFFPPSALEAVIKAPASVGLGGKEMFVTVLFCDIRNYTSLSFTLEPRQVAQMLNQYFPAMVKCVFRWGGTLEKYIGDALMAIWGAPFEMPLEQQMQRAAQAALEMQRAVRGMNLAWSGVAIEIGIGINTGRAYVGNIGDESYLQYAAIGSTTNLAARLCGCAGAGEVILSGDSLECLPAGSAQVQARGKVSVKGFPGDISIYSLHEGA